MLIEVNPLIPGAKSLKSPGSLAYKHTVSKDKKTYTFYLRKGVTFHDGSVLDSEDVVASWKKIVFPPEGVLSARKAMYSMVDSITAKGKYLVIFKLKFPSPAFLPALAMPYNYIYSADILKKDMRWYEQHVMGSGPFELVEYTDRVRIKGKRFKKYFQKGKPYVDEIEGIFAAKQSVYVAALESGQIQGMFRGLPPAAVSDLLKAKPKGFNVQYSTWNCSLVATPNSHKKPFSDVKVRRALNLALDRWGGSGYLAQRAIVKTVGGVSFPGHPLSPSVKQLRTLEGFGTNMKKARAQARQLLKEAGIPEGFEFTLRNRTTDQPYKVVGIWVIDQWRKIGLKVKQDTIPTNAFWASLRRPKANMGDPDAFQVQMDFNCQALVNPAVDISKYLPGAGNNYGKYDDDVLTDLYERQSKEPNFKKQKALIWQYEQRVNAMAWTIPTLWWHRAVVTSKRLHNWNISPSHYLNMGFADIWLSKK